MTRWFLALAGLGDTGLVVFDTATDTVVRYDVDARCAGITQAIELPSGDAYFVSSSLAGVAHRLGRLSSEPCALRVLAGEDRFDPGYALRLADVTGGAIAGEPVAFRGDELLLRVFDESRANIEKDAHTWDLTGQAAWGWARWDVQTNGFEPMDALGASTADVFTFHLDGKVYASETKTDYSETTLIDLTSESGPERALRIPGFLQGIARIR
jgi:hypothetical protein